jgi:hypothetical protein
MFPVMRSLIYCSFFTQNPTAIGGVYNLLRQEPHVLVHSDIMAFLSNMLSYDIFIRHEHDRNYSTNFIYETKTCVSILTECLILFQ